MKKYLRYIRTGILLILILSAPVMGYLFYYRQVPSSFCVPVEEEQSLNLNIPASGSVVTASKTAVMNLSHPVKILGGNRIGSYKMNVKLLGIIPLKEVEIQVVEGRKVASIGLPIGIFVKTRGVMVVGVGSFEDVSGNTVSPSKGKLEEGDYLLSYNNQEIKGKREFLEKMGENHGEPIQLLVKRKDREQWVEISPCSNMSGDYKLGIWIRDNAQGVGTLTYVDEEGNFGALGHGIADSDTGLVMDLGKGSLYETEIVGIRKSAHGAPGELTGLIAYDDENVLGKITENRNNGIFGKLDMEKLGRDFALRFGEEDDCLILREMALKQEVREGEAEIICSVSGTPKIYRVQITRIRLGEAEKGKGLEIQVTDPELINLTGGIIQGMSGSPILQDGKIVGAVTHVFVDDPTKGYGIFIENMVE